VLRLRFNIMLRVALLSSGAVLFFTSQSVAQTIQTPQQTTPATVAIHEVTDEMGRTLHIPVNPTRIVSLAPSLTETVYALGAQDRLVGDTIYCDYPPDAQKKTKVGGVADPNLEEIAALHPDLVLMTKNGNALDTVRALESLGISAYATNPRKIAEILTSTEKLAEVLNVPEAGKTVADDMQRRLTVLQTKLKDVSPKNVLFIVWTEPLISVGRGTFVADAIGKAGAVSIVNSDQDWPQVSLEEIVHLQPDYLIFAHSQSDVVEHGFESVANLPGWNLLAAVRTRHYVVISDAVIRPAPRIVSAIEDLAKQLHPEVFAEPQVPEKASPTPNSASVFDFPFGPDDDCSSVSIHSVELSCAR
jgi:iron complex transport system substrate-binding protein